VSAIALVGDEPELAEHILAVLLERGIAAADLRVFSKEELHGTTLSAGEEDFRVELAEAPELAGSDAVVFFGGPELARELSGSTPPGAIVVDATSWSRGQAGAVLVVPEVNAGRVAEAGEGVVLAVPTPAVVGLAIALAPLHEAARVRRVVATVLHPASAAGAGGVQRLSRQSVTLLQGRSLDPEEDPELLAHNVRPVPGSAESAFAPSEQEIARETAALFGEPRIEVLATVLRVPVFYGIGQSLYVEMEESLDADEAERILRDAPSVVVASDDVEGEAAREAAEDVELDDDEPQMLRDPCPGPVDVNGSDAVHVARVRVDPRRPGSLALWISFDDQRKGVALSVASILEIAMRERR